MSIHRLNHAVLYVRDTARSVAFYRDVLGFEVVDELGNGAAAFLRAAASTNDHDLGLFAIGPGAAASPAGRSAVGLYHLAWEVDTLRDLEALAQALTEAGALVGASDHSTTKSLYGHDPDGLEFEIAWVVPGRPPRRRRARPAARRSVRSTWPARSSATAPTRRAGSA